MAVTTRESASPVSKERKAAPFALAGRTLMVASRARALNRLHRCRRGQSVVQHRLQPLRGVQGDCSTGELPPRQSANSELCSNTCARGAGPLCSAWLHELRSWGASLRLPDASDLSLQRLRHASAERVVDDAEAARPQATQRLAQLRVRQQPASGDEDKQDLPFLHSIPLIHGHYGQNKIVLSKPLRIASLIFVRSFLL